MVNTEGMNAVCGLVLAVSPLQVMQCEGNKVGAHQKLRDRTVVQVYPTYRGLTVSVMVPISFGLFCLRREVGLTSILGPLERPVELGLC